MSGGTFIAVDWGTTHRRAYLVEGGRASEVQADGLGAGSMDRDGYPAEMARLRETLGDHPVLIAGMAGADIGWRRAPYATAPATLADLAKALTWTEERTAIVPGVSWTGPEACDVMRGEEIQALGALACGAAQPGALLCQPGTHCKWIETQDGAVTRFTTAMTGEFFALLQTSTLLRTAPARATRDSEAFLEGVAAGARGDLLGSLFSARARTQLGTAPADLRSYVSGIVIGADVAARLAQGPREIVILADGGLGDLYAAAVGALGGVSRPVSARQAFVAGMAGLWEILN
jgi:2-dehydro-3-deoxygalactonokinase